MESLLQPVDIRPVWPSVKAGLEVVRRRCPNVTWTVEDVYAACLNEQAVLLRDDDCFAVVQSSQDPHSLRRTLWVWAAYGRPSTTLQARLDDYARRTGHSELRLTSSRPGWARKAGWAWVESTYRKEL